MPGYIPGFLPYDPEHANIYIYIFLSCFSVCFFQSSEIYGTSRIRRSTPCCVSYSTRNTQMSNRPELCPCCRTPGRLPRGKVQRRHTKREHHIIISLRSCRRPRRSSPCACSAREGVHTPRTAPLSSWYHMYIYIYIRGGAITSWISIYPRVSHTITLAHPEVKHLQIYGNFREGSYPTRRIRK